MKVCGPDKLQNFDGAHPSIMNISSSLWKKPIKVTMKMPKYLNSNIEKGTKARRLEQHVLHPDSLLPLIDADTLAVVSAV